MHGKSEEAMTIKEYLNWFREDWPKVGGIVSVFLAIYLAVIFLPGNPLLFAILLATPLYMLHEFDEYVIPGKFAQFMNRNIFKTDAESGLLDTKAVFWINMAVWILISLSSLWAFFDISQVIALPYFYLFQAVIHLVLGIAGKRFINPGMLTAWLLHVPWGIWTIRLLLQAGAITNPYWNAGLRDGLLIVLAMMLANRILVARYKRRQQRL
jgi:hypothetical protein